MRSEAQHEVHDDDRHFGIARFLQQATDTVGWVDHRVRLTVGEVVIAEIEEGVFDAAIDIAQAISRIRLNVAINIRVFFQYREHGFIAQGTAAEQAANVLLLWRELRANVSNQRLVQRMYIEIFLLNTAQQDGLQRRVFSAAGELQAWLIGGRLGAAEEARHHRFTAGASAFEHFFATAGAGGLETRTIISVCGSASSI